MNKQIIDDLLSAMIASKEGISDLLFTVDRPPLIEAYGALEEFSVETPRPLFGRQEIGQLADHIINGKHGYASMERLRSIWPLPAPYDAISR